MGNMAYGPQSYTGDIVAEHRAPASHFSYLEEYFEKHRHHQGLNYSEVG